MEPTLKGWVWEIPFYPCTVILKKDYRILKSIFWYDSSDPLAFVPFTEGYEILVPEYLIQNTPEDLEYVRTNKEKFISSKEPILVTDYQGNWRLRPFIQVAS